MTSSTSSDITKGFGLPETIDPNHEYIYRSGEYGLYSYWYKDGFGNYWLYTNAPEGHPDFDEHAGEAMVDPNQPLPHSSPEYFTSDGFKRNQAVPVSAEPKENPDYNPMDSRNIWSEVYQSGDGSMRYVYLDTDVRESLDLWVQHQLRVVDSVVGKFRKYAGSLFESNHPKDKVFGAVMMLVDQGCYEVEELIGATVADIQFIDQTVLLLGRKFVCDIQLYDFLTSLVGSRDPSEPLFMLNTIYGKNHIGFHHIHSLFESVRVSPKFLLSWHASHMYSRIVHRLSTQQVPPEQMEEVALDELQAALNAEEDVSWLVDQKVKTALSDAYEQSVIKSLSRVQVDDYGVFVVLSDLTVKKPDELQFSVWLHSTPMHDATPEEEEAVQMDFEAADAEAEAAVSAPVGQDGEPTREPQGEGTAGAGVAA